MEESRSIFGLQISGQAKNAREPEQRRHSDQKKEEIFAFLLTRVVRFSIIGGFISLSRELSRAHASNLHCVQLTGFSGLVTC